MRVKWLYTLTSLSVGLTGILCLIYYTNHTDYENAIPKGGDAESVKHKGRNSVQDLLLESGFDILNADLCPDMGKKLKLLVAVASAPHHEKSRMAIRMTWGHYGQRRDVVIGFLLGMSNVPATDARVKAEEYLYGDIIRFRFTDTYYNLALKIVFLTEWIDSFCSGVRFLLKTDDDMFINMPRLLSFVDRHFNQTRTIYGHLAKSWKPHRSRKSKYFISVKEFSPLVYPDFVTGPAYLVSGDIIHDICQQSLKKRHLHLEDVFITGVIAETLSIRRINIKDFLNRNIDFRNGVCKVKNYISIHMVTYRQQFIMWQVLFDDEYNCDKSVTKGR